MIQLLQPTVLWTFAKTRDRNCPVRRHLWTLARGQPCCRSAARESPGSLKFGFASKRYLLEHKG
jgi:hypothetical protein